MTLSLYPSACVAPIVIRSVNLALSSFKRFTSAINVVSPSASNFESLSRPCSVFIKLLIVSPPVYVSAIAETDFEVGLELFPL